MPTPHTLSWPFRQRVRLHAERPELVDAALLKLMQIDGEFRWLLVLSAYREGQINLCCSKCPSWCCASVSSSWGCRFALVRPMQPKPGQKSTPSTPGSVRRVVTQPDDRTPR
jgi:hypothetical protein